MTRTTLTSLPPAPAACRPPPAAYRQARRTPGRSVDTPLDTRSFASITPTPSQYLPGRDARDEDRCLRSQYVLFGTDMPLGGPHVVADTIADINSLALAGPNRAAIFAGNARRSARPVHLIQPAQGVNSKAMEVRWLVPIRATSGWATSGFRCRDVIAQSVGLMGPVFSVGVPGPAGRRRDQRVGQGRRVAASLSVLIAAIGVLGLGWIVSSYARKIHAAGSLYDYVTGGLGRAVGHRGRVAVLRRHHCRCSPGCCC